MRLTDAKDTEHVCLTVVLRSGGEQLEVLLARNHEWDEIWSLPGGHQMSNETPEEAAARELREETGIKTTVKFLTHVDNHPTRNEPADVFYCSVPAETEAKANDNVGMLRWWSVDGLLVNATDQDLIRAAVKEIHDPEALVQEAVEVLNYPELNAPISPKGCGLLVAFEGKNLSVYTKALTDWLTGCSCPSVIVKPTMSEVLQDDMDLARRRRKLSAMTESTINAVDWLVRWEKIINPHLNTGKAVICEGYLRETKNRMVRRGLEPFIFDALFHFMPQPDVLLEVNGESPEDIVKLFCSLTK